MPSDLTERVNVGDYTKIRFYSDDLHSLHELAEDRIREIRRAFAGQVLEGRTVQQNSLSLSGGGGDGAFGVGVITGWSASGTRPNFNVVTGISTGSLIAVFAYLGSEYDGVLKQAYTTITTADVLEEHTVSALIGLSPSLSSSNKFEELVAKYLTPQVMEAIAGEYRKGRMLLIGTTNLDAQRAVIWDIGRIAAKGGPDSVDLVRHIIVASASMPGVFPPVRIKVNADGKTYDELHVDGGVTRQIFLFPPGYNPKVVDAAIKWHPQRRAFIIRNGRVDAEFEATKDSLLPVASRSISTLIKTQGAADLYKIAYFCRDNNIDFNLAYIPPEFTGVSKEMFDTKYMNQLYDFASQQASAGYRWQKEPPGLAHT